MKMKRLSAVTRSDRTFERHTRNDEGDIVRKQVTEKVSVNDLYTPRPRKDTRVFWRGARIA